MKIKKRNPKPVSYAEQQKCTTLEKFIENNPKNKERDNNIPKKKESGVKQPK